MRVVVLVIGACDGGPIPKSDNTILVLGDMEIVCRVNGFLHDDGGGERLFNPRTYTVA